MLYEFVLMDDFGARITLQPRQLLLLLQFNRVFQDSYDRCAIKTKGGQWLSEHDWIDAFDDDDIEAWTSISFTIYGTAFHETIVLT
jgi:hypothetical protein